MGQVSYAAYVNEITEDCWRRAGIGAGMRVLDAGCGSGESTFLAARLVGPDGYVVGLDRDHNAIRLARRAADERWIENLEFREGDGQQASLLGEAPFDAVVGRYFLVHQDDPASVLRKLSRLVRPGGVVAFLEEELEYGHRSEPSSPALSLAVDRRQAADRESGRHLHMVTGFARFFLEAGLGWPDTRAYQAALGGAASDA